MQVPWSQHPWNVVGVYGLGISGRAAVELLRQHGARVVAIDDRSSEQLELDALARDPEIELWLDGEAGDVAMLDGLVSSPGVPADRPVMAAARRHGVPIIAEVELAFHFLEGEVVGITGSNGKSTTTALTGAMLEAAGRKVEVCGNIGEALSSRVDGESGRVFVVELSSFQLESTDRFHPESAALLNLSHDHLDRHGDLDSYLAAKASIFRRQQPSDLAVLNADDPHVAGLDVAAHRRFFSSQTDVSDGCFLRGDSVMEASPDDEPSELFRRGDVPLAGPHNLENAMAAALLARAHGAAPRDVVAGMKAFRGLPHRLERLAEIDGVTWFDDSKGTNLAATARSLEGFEDGAVHIILGGRYKGGDLSELRPLLLDKARRAYLIGESARAFADMLQSGDGEIPFEMAETLDQAVASASRQARNGEVVLLSPACASFDQFDNFAQRGRVFQRLVKALPGGDHGAQAGL